MAIKTYIPITSQTLGSTQTSITFSSIPQIYSSLILVVSAKDSRTEINDGYGLTFNSDTSTGSTNYSDTYLAGYNTSGYSGKNTSYRQINLHQVTASTSNSLYFSTSITHIENYSNPAIYKTVLNRGGTVEEVYAAVGTWRNTAPITSITLYPGYNGSAYTFAVNSTFTLYGIA